MGCFYKLQDKVKLKDSKNNQILTIIGIVRICTTNLSNYTIIILN